MSNCTVAAKQQAKQCLINKGNLLDLANTLQKSTVATKAGQAALQGFAIGGNMLAMWLISQVVSAISSCITANGRLKKSAEELGSEFASTKSNIEDYQSQINSLYETINDSTSSYEDTYTARQNLLALQDEMIEKFDDEAEAVSLVTDKVLIEF